MFKSHSTCNQMKEDSYYNPAKNPNAISIVKDEDGNWSGEMYKFEKNITAREVGPEIVLQKLLTHE